MTSHFAHGAASVPAKGVGRGCARKLPLAASASGGSCAGPRRRAPSQASAIGSGPWRPPWRCGRLSGAGSRMWRGGGVARRGPPVGLAVPGSRPPGLRSAAPRVRPLSPRARHQPERATERPNNGAITNPCCAVIRPLRRPQVLHRKLIPLPPDPPLTHWRPGRPSGQRSAGLWPSLSRAHDGEGGPRQPFDQADPARSTVLVRTPSGAGRNQATYPEHVRVSSPVSPAVPRARLRGGASHEAKGRRGARGGPGLGTVAWRLTSARRGLADEGPPAHPASPGRVRLEFLILSLNPGLGQRCVAPSVWPTTTRCAATRR